MSYKSRRKQWVTDDKVEQVKQHLKCHGIRETARKTGISYYTCWHISKGTYDTDKPLKQAFQEIQMEADGMFHHFPLNRVIF